ncbi:restriction endonuclease subunit S [Escherichia coli]|uniref:restriction endonuclease subunit S n=1 Tax=Escherichia coli TaxID=562 RepID=UPI001EFE36D3|nr:restriction endonuclease subunit S [Escherichia coli]MCG9390997.1 restriction endonuclease subunit S [Escherichia coli]MCG9452408.1 restriction endonuclease subunit S [Escherichia coli]MCG9457057.1 restriction endonuclease subunit S [Escherichia coli]MCG9475757.1 restriction endonuclease subunit S [Escherichia coli]
MSELSYLEKLLDGVEVEWKMLGEVIHSLKTGLNPRQNFSLNTLDAQGYYVTVREIQNGKVVFLDKTDRVNDRALKIINGRSNLEAGDILFSGTGTVGRIAVIEENPINWNIKEGVYTIKPIKEKIAPRFLSYLLQSSKIVKDYSKKIVGNPVISLPMGDLKKLLIPIPCPDNPEKSLAIQSEIVRILDKFTALTAELTAELNMRKKQYNYYRDQLLSFKDGEVEWKTLGEIGDFTYGYAAKAMDSGDARFVRITDINKDGKLSKENPMYVELNEENEKYTLDKNDLLMARTGATFGKTMIFEEDYPAVYAGFLIKLNLNKTIINAKYYWHFAQSDFFWEQANKLVSGGGQPQFNANALKQVRVPIPYPSHPQKSLDEQGRIVDILDKFDAIAASITEGLPREIELRQKQYEYYRDLLFSFPKPETASN